jgi:hypothetical protein
MTSSTAPSTAPIFMETINKLGVGYLFGLRAESKPSPGRSSATRPGRAESRAEATERLRLVAARSGKPADLRDYLAALAALVPAMSPDNCRLVAGLLRVGMAPAFRDSATARLPYPR